MTDIYTQENGSKKKFLAPVLVILLCMVSLTAAGYAYSATVDNQGDVVPVTGVSLALYESDGQTLVTDAMYKANGTGVNIATHTVNGKAANPDGYAFLTASTFEAYDANHLANYMSGFYVEALVNDTPAGYNAALPDIHDDETYTAATATPGLNGLFALDGTYKLTVDNQSGATASVKMKVQLDAAFPTPNYAIKAVYVIITDANGDFVAISAASTSATLAEFATVGAGSTTYTVNAYVVISDYYSATVPAAAEYNDVGFSVRFSADA